MQNSVDRADVLELARRLQSLLLTQGFHVVVPYKYDPTSMDVYIGDYHNYGYYVEICVSAMLKSIVYVRGPISRPCDTIPILVEELHKLRIRNKVREYCGPCRYSDDRELLYCGRGLELAVGCTSFKEEPAHIQ